jgi:hypothetical protein
MCAILNDIYCVAWKALDAGFVVDGGTKTIGPSQDK